MGQKTETDYGFKLSSEKTTKKLDSIKTFSIDDELPSLPLPKLETTLKKYLTSIKPFVTEIEYLEAESICSKFKNGIGGKLQFLLENKAKNERNWLEKWWLDWAYLEWRLPISPLINTVGFNFVIDTKITNPNVDLQLSLAATEIHFYLKFYHDLKTQVYPVQRSRNSYLSMSQFRNYYNSCRIPLVNKDRLDIHFKTFDEGHCSTQLVIMYHNNFFVFDAFQDNELLNPHEVYHQLAKIKTKYNKTYGVGIGALTADYRDDWARNRQYLMELDPKNPKIFDIIEKACLLVCLDDTNDLTPVDVLNLIMLQKPKNRYFDKACNLIFGKNNGGTCTEHSAFDGMVGSSISSYITQMKKEMNYKLDEMTTRFTVRHQLDHPQLLEFNFDSKIENEIKKSVEIFEKQCSTIEYSVLKIDFCSKEKIKSYKTNPDTFAQMCMQLAYFKLHNKPAPTYESAMTRAYHHGRTETVRSCTQDALEWSRQMCNKTSSRLNNSDLLGLFRKACQTHDTLMKEARDNHGCDRHLLGLMLMAKELNIEKPDIYKHCSWAMR
jgi:carnitine O-octanoyltransferase